jgi:hypothetical protein
MSATVADAPTSYEPGTHQCPAQGCAAPVDDNKLLCWGDWRRVPADLQRALYAAYDRGRGQGTPAHLAAMRACIDAADAKRARRG